uniref:CCHC-type domain-containing protein n=1 Tax=Tanacetum cinerariifolium TaxID=118510 RepID=A0A6L2MAA5_TANCI|nr:hypothetical protein [Tanacetum cinerariifolium]
MSGTIPPIPPSLGTSTGSPSSLNANRVDMMPNADPTNTTTTNVARNVVEENNDNLPQLLDRPSDTRDTKIVAFNAFKALKVNATFFNSLPRKWLSMNQTQRVNNSIKNDSLAALYGKYHYKEVLINDIYASETQRFTIQSSSSKALISNIYSQDSDSDVEEDNRTINEFMADLNAKYHERALLANQKRFYKRSGRVGLAKKPMDKSKETCFACGKPGHFQKDCPSNKTSTPSYPSSNTSFNKSKPYTPSFTPNIS